MNRFLIIDWRGLAAVVLCAAAACGDELSLTPRSGVVLLNNGELIAGQIVAAGDRYDVRLESGQISLKRSDVAIVCRDAAECYLHKRDGIELDRAQDHLELAEWCIKNNLLDEADKELAAARAVDPSHPMARLVASRLALAREPKKTTPAAEPARPAGAKPGGKSGGAKSPADAKLDLPEGAMGMFTNTIQPLLLNYCTGSGCHTSHGPAAFKLERIHPKLSGRLTTQRNLQRALRLIDPVNPPASRLLQTPIRPHGGAKAPVFTRREQDKYQQLVVWVLAVSAAQPKPAEPAVARQTRGTTKTDRARPGSASRGPAPDRVADVAGPDVAARPATLETPDAAGLPAPNQPDGRRIPASSADQAYTRAELRAMGIRPESGSDVHQVQYGAEVAPEFVPQDPFDPEIFNRQFFKR